MIDPENSFWNDRKTIKEFASHPKDSYWEEVLRDLKNRKSKRALDLGCGGGRNTETLAKLGFEIYACDYYEGMVEATKARLKGCFGKKLNSRVIKADMRDLPYEDEYFDVVLANGVYHNVNSIENLYTSIRETARILKEKGILLVNIFTSDDWDKKSLKKIGKNLFQTTNGMKMVLVSSDSTLKNFELFGFKSIKKIQKYIRGLEVGQRSVLKTVFVKNGNANHHFPSKPKVERLIDDELLKRFNEIPSLNDKSEIQRLGFAMTSPHKKSVEVHQKFMKKNNNNVGVHTLENQPLTGTRELEKESINWLADLYGDSSVDGYITSGGTEGNIMGIWIGRERLRSRGLNKISLLISPLTHISFTKAAKILDINIVKVPLDKNYAINIDDFLRLIQKLKSNEGIIIALTAGYYSTGTSDNISEICERLQKLNIKNIYVHIDAAFGGFVYPFTDPDFKFDFRNKLINSMTIDPHKMGMMPYSCGVFLCRKGLLNYVENENAHAGVKDRTLIGSRSGAAAAALWATISSLGFSGYKGLLLKCLKNKRYLINELRKIDYNLHLLSKPNINNFAVSFTNFEKGRLPKEVENKYRLVPNELPLLDKSKTENSRIYYHFYIMPHVSKNTIDRFVRDLNKNYA